MRCFQNIVLFLIVMPLISGLQLSDSRGDALPNKLLGIWSEPASEYGKCGEKILEIWRDETKYLISGRSGDWVCSWRGVRKVASETSTEGRVDAYSVKEECHYVETPTDESPGSAVILHILRKGDSYEDLYIGSPKGAYSGLYRRCMKVNLR